MAIDQIAQSGLSSIKVIYNSAQLFSQETGVRNFQAESESIFPERNIAFRSDSFISIINVISQSELLGYVPEPIFEFYKDFLNLQHVKAPFTLPFPDIYMLYNRSSLNSSVFSSFIEKINLE